MSDKKLTEDNYSYKAFYFRDRQAGVSEVYNPHSGSYTYNAYCLETKIVKELFSSESDFLEDALNIINDEFGNWELRDIAPDKKSGCGDCVAKK
tara:strand:- start:336 stop:617 length:282 start_codon:yes stop_codon:yes gene_type:complete